MMKPNLSFLFLITMVLFICLIVGCIGEQPNSSVTLTQGEGIASIPQVKGYEKIGLNEIFNQIQMMNSENQNFTPPLKIFSVTSIMPNPEGKSEHWLLITKQAENIKFIELDSRHVLINNWYGNVPENEIEREKIVLPEEIFGQNQIRLKEYSNAGWVIDKMELSNGVYNLSLIKGSDQKIFSFNAGNGDFLGST